MKRTQSRTYLVVALIMCVTAIALMMAGCGSKQPQVASTSPNPGASDVPASPPVVEVIFDQPMDKASTESAIMITPSVGGTPNYSWSNDDKTVAVNYGEAFAPGTAYTFMVMKTAASAKNATLADDYELKFTTVTAPTAAPPSPVPPGVMPPPPPPPGAAPTTRTAPAKPKQPTESTGAGTGQGPAVTFTKDIKPLADARCKSCHQTKMSDYDNIIAKKLVVPKKSAESPYYTKGIAKVPHTGGNAWKDKADLVKSWIVAGAVK